MDSGYEDGGIVEKMCQNTAVLTRGHGVKSEVLSFAAVYREFGSIVFALF